MHKQLYGHSYCHFEQVQETLCYSSYSLKFIGVETLSMLFGRSDLTPFILSSLLL